MLQIEAEEEGAYQGFTSVSVDMGLTAAITLSSRLISSPPSLSPFFDRDHQFSNYPPGPSLGSRPVNSTVRVHVTYALESDYKRYLRSHVSFAYRLHLQGTSVCLMVVAHLDVIAEEATPEQSQRQEEDKRDHTVPSPSSMRDWIRPQTLFMPISFIISSRRTFKAYSGPLGLSKF